MQEIITYLEMTDPGALCGPSKGAPAFDFGAVLPADPALNRWLYDTVGAAWLWTDRRDWRDSDWQAHAARADTELWVARVEGEPIGFVELARQPSGEVEIAYFGLLPAYIGKGYGAAVLTAGVEAAWQGDTRRVWLHTCNFDHPQALPNYLARGFSIYEVRDASRASKKAALASSPGLATACRSEE